jgi:RimJ/RimL family protein N-acetyltransferase
MENKQEKNNSFEIALPKLEDALEIANMHIRAWKETYLPQTTEISSETIDGWFSHYLTDLSFRESTITKSLEFPNEVFYKLIKNNKGKIIGFIHGSKSESENTLEAIYLLNEAKGKLNGSKMMQDFLNWCSRDRKIVLDVFAFNLTAIAFYEKFGFEIEPENVKFFKEKLKVLTMAKAKVEQ